VRCDASSALRFIQPTALHSALLQGQLPDYNEPVIIPRNKATVEDFCNRIHKARRRRDLDRSIHQSIQPLSAVLYAKSRAASQSAGHYL
jgi:hypothetical protein